MRSTFVLLVVSAIAALGFLSSWAPRAKAAEWAPTAYIASGQVAMPYAGDYPEQPVACTQSAGGSCGCGCDWRESSRSAGVIGGYDIVWLKPHFSNATSYGTIVDEGGTGGGSAVDHSYRTDYELTPRFWLGYQWCNGFGARARYCQFVDRLGSGAFSTDVDTDIFVQYGSNNPWESDSIWAEDEEILAFAHRMKMDVVDVEATQNLKWRHTRLTAGGGVRYAKIRFQSESALFDEVATDAVSVENTFEGVGPTVFLDVERSIGQTGFSVVGGLRGSVLFGRRRYNLLWLDLGEGADWEVTQRGYRATGVLEASIGVQYNVCLCRGTDAFARCTWEGQLWNDVGSPTTVKGDLAMEGLSIAVGITR